MGHTNGFLYCSSKTSKTTSSSNNSSSSSNSNNKETEVDQFGLGTRYISSKFLVLEAFLSIKSRGRKLDMKAFLTMLVGLVRVAL